MGEVIATRDAEDWQARFIEAGIPGATVRPIREAFDHPHVALRDMLVGFDHPIGRHLKVAGDPIKLSGHAHATFAPAPGLDEHTQLILRELLGLTPDAITGLHAKKIVWWPKEGLCYSRPSVV